MSFRIAAKAAERSKFERYRLGAVVVKGSRVLSTGFNDCSYNGITKTRTTHAEEAAITKLLRARRFSDLVGSDLYVLRITKGGRTALSKPCDRCMHLIRSVGIRTVHYTTDSGTGQSIRCMD